MLFLSVPIKLSTITDKIEGLQTVYITRCGIRYKRIYFQKHSANPFGLKEFSKTQRMFEDYIPIDDFLDVRFEDLNYDQLYYEINRIRLFIGNKIGLDVLDDPEFTLSFNRLYAMDVLWNSKEYLGYMDAYNVTECVLNRFIDQFNKSFDNCFVRGFMYDEGFKLYFGKTHRKGDLQVKSTLSQSGLDKFGVIYNLMMKDGYHDDEAIYSLENQAPILVDIPIDSFGELLDNMPIHIDYGNPNLYNINSLRDLYNYDIFNHEVVDDENSYFSIHRKDSIYDKGYYDLSPIMLLENSIVDVNLYEYDKYDDNNPIYLANVSMNHQSENPDKLNEMMLRKLERFPGLKRIEFDYNIDGLMKLVEYIKDKYEYDDLYIFESCLLNSVEGIHDQVVLTTDILEFINSHANDIKMIQVLDKVTDADKINLYDYNECDDDIDLRALYNISYVVTMFVKDKLPNQFMVELNKEGNKIIDVVGIIKNNYVDDIMCDDNTFDDQIISTQEFHLDKSNKKLIDATYYPDNNAYNTFKKV